MLHGPGSMEIPAQGLKNPIIEGFLEKRRPSKRYLSLKYQKRWCVIHQDKFYYYESNTDKKQKGVFSLEGYTFYEKENHLTFDLKCAGQRTFEFVCSSTAELKQWRKAIKTASMYRIGPTGKKKREPEVPVPPLSSAEQDDDIYADSNEIKKHLERTQSRDIGYGGQQDQAEVKQQLERTQSKEDVLDRRPIPSPRTTRRHHHHYNRRHDNPKGQRSKHRNRHPMPSPEASSVSSPNKQSVDEENGYITVKKGGPRKVMTKNHSVDEEYGYITVNKGPRKVIKHSDLVKEQSFQNANSDDNGNEALYLQLLGDNQLPSNNGPLKQNSSETLPPDPIYQNTNDPLLQYTTVLPKKMRDMQIGSPYATAKTNNDVISDSDEYTSSSDEESSDSELDDYENAQMFGISQNAH